VKTPEGDTSQFVFEKEPPKKLQLGTDVDTPWKKHLTDRENATPKRTRRIPHHKATTTFWEKPGKNKEDQAQFTLGPNGPPNKRKKKREGGTRL